MRFLNSLSISVVGVLKDSQNYVHSAERGLSIHEMPTSRMKIDAERWEPIISWLEEKLEAPLTPRDFARPEVGTEIRRLAMSANRDKPQN